VLPNILDSNHQKLVKSQDKVYQWIY